MYKYAKLIYINFYNFFDIIKEKCFKSKNLNPKALHWHIAMNCKCMWIL